MPADTRGLADGVADALAGSGRAVARVHLADFLRARSLRLEHGVDPEAYLERWYDLGTLGREVLGPLGPGGSLRYLPRLRDAASDRPFRDPAVAVPAGAVLAVDGPFLTRRPLAEAFDVLVFLDVTAGAVRRRLADGEGSGMVGAWQQYVAACHPATRADLVVRFDHPDRPAVVRP